MKKIFIHCGLHKTGTTALQTAFMQKSGVLRKYGVLYPRSGRLDTLGSGLGGGHHNIAWEVSRDRRFRLNLGNISKLIEEINAFSGNVVLASEDFESALAEPNMMRNFIERISACHAEIYIVMNVRNQLAYCQSIYTENLGQSVGEEYMRYVNDIARGGFVRFKEWIFHFNYLALIDFLSSLPAHLIVRNFHGLTKQSSIADFLHVIGLDDEHFKEHIGYRANQRPPITEAIERYYINRFNKPPEDMEIMATRMISRMVGDKKLINLASTKAMFHDAFAAGNKAMCERFGFSYSGFDLLAETPKNGAYYEKLFSFELQCLIPIMANLMKDGQWEQAEGQAEAFVAAATAP